MQLQVKGKNMPVTDALYEHAERKLQRLTRILPPWDGAMQIELELSVERNPRTCTQRIWLRGIKPLLKSRHSFPSHRSHTNVERF